MKLSYIPGCMLEGSAREYDRATRAVFEKLGVDLVEPPGWQCCGGTSARSYDDERWAKLNRDNLKLCRSLGHEVVLACAICLRNLEEAKR
ncbi:MAG: heterodisulfide reductase-related iron-sulfur binding cluster, partial [Planctomycetota bacterium]